jgi:hypothetical protein
LDNHESHLSIEVLDYAKDNGVVMLSFPPHCGHQLQPLDRTVFGPFKKYSNKALKDLMFNKPAHRPDIYDIAALVAQAFSRAMTVDNIISGFRVTGIYPHNPDIFPDDAFLPARVTDRPDPPLAVQLPDQPGVSTSTAGVSPSRSLKTPVKTPNRVCVSKHQSTLHRRT